MSKYILGFVLLLISATAMAQKPGKSRVQLVESKTTRFEKLSNGKVVYHFTEATFKQDFSTLTSDSSIFYSDDNLVDAFGHVVINQGDTLHIFSDKLHYDGNTKIATLTGNVKMVDKDATLLTDFLTYNTATKIGTYMGGGKLFNKENTLTSKNGYYFAGSRDAYFRHDVVFTTADAIIKTDTLRYNSGSRISWFYGPTTIYGKKDKDELYTENGRYETIPEQAFFGKKNLYTQGTKSLKGDSLFYDRLKGYGRAVKNVVFDDKEQRITVKGHLGEYYKESERAIITQNPYVIFVTQDSSQNKAQAKKDSLNNAADSLAQAPIKKDSLTKVAANAPTLKSVTDSVMKAAQQAAKPQANKNQPNKNAPAAKPTLKAVTDTLFNAAQKNSQQKNTDKPKTDSVKVSVKEQVPPNTAGVDSMYMGADTIDTRIITFKQLKEMKRARFLIDHPDSAAKLLPSVILTKETLPKVLTLKKPKLPFDTSFVKRDFFSPKPKQAPKAVAKAALPKAAADTIVASKKALTAKDSLALNPNNLSDTSRVRIIIGYHGAKIFKSDLQAKADSLFYSSSDSTIRMYVNPIIWTQGSQLTGDTIALQMKNRKLDNVDLFPNGFIVNIEKNDSLHFNQAGGRKIHGTFKDNRLNSMDIDGNAETIYYNRDTVKNIVTEMIHSVSSVVKARFKEGKLYRGNTYGNTENKINPVGKLTDDDKILKGFIWKPKERPASKEAVTGGANNVATSPVKPTATKKPGTTGTTTAKKNDGKKPGAAQTDKPAETTDKNETPTVKPITYDIRISN